MTRRGPWLSTFLVLLFAALPMAAQQDDRINQLEQKLDELLRSQE